MLKPITLTLVPDGMYALPALRQALGERTGAHLYKKIVERVGKEPGPPLGHGMKGVVYDLGDGRVLKITSDASEVQAMTIMRGVNHSNLVRVDDIFVMCRGQSGVGVVVREWVGNVLENIEEMDYLNSLIRLAVDDSEEAILDVYREDHPDTQATKLGMQDLMDRLEEAGGSKAEREIIQGLRAGIHKLLNLGIYGVDFDPRNIAVDNNGNAVIFDVGVVNLGTYAQVERIDCPVGRRIVSPA